MKPCSFWSDSHQAANSPHCSTHGDRHPFECAEELRKELDAALLQVDALKVVLQKVEWATDSGCSPESRWCPECENRRESGHTEACSLGHALHGAFPPGVTEKPKDDATKVVKVKNLDELEQVLNFEDKRDIRINPDGTVTENLGLDVATYEAAKKEQAEGKRVPIEDVIRDVDKRNGEKCKKCDLPLESEAHREECR